MAIQNPKYTPDIANLYCKLGDNYYLLGKIEKAFEFYKQYYQFSSKHYNANLDNNKLLEHYGISCFKLAMIYKENSNHKAGEEFFLNFKKINLMLLNYYPDVIKYKQWSEMNY
jgi:tetratricopeptide (TPR) repeat protein